MAQSSESVRLDFVSLAGEQSIGVVTLARPEVSNALSGEMITRLTTHLETVSKKGESCRALVLRSKGKHFSGGADLEWMKQSARLTYDENLKESHKLSSLFGTLAHLELPTVALVQGAIYGGAVGLVACCDWAIAEEGARFCLSEVKVGLLPATILPFLAHKMPAGQLRRYGLSARPFGASEASHAGLVQRVAKREEMDSALREELGLLLAGSPQAQRSFKALHRQILSGGAELWTAQQEQMVKGIADARVSDQGQKGLQAFFDKQAPEWVVHLPEDWKLPEP